MEIGSVIREKRTAQGLTQEQVATALGVSAPAVSKWERGESFPEITLLPALARLLGTDLNGLLSFQQEMGREEIAAFLGRLVQVAEEGPQAAFALARAQVGQFPRCDSLALNVALTLEGVLTMAGREGSAEEREWIQALYRQAAESRDQAARMGTLVHRCMQLVDLAHCQTAEGAAAELKRLGEDKQGGEEALQIDPQAIARFAASPLGRRAGQAQCLREYQFSALFTPKELGVGQGEEEEILMNGIIDLLLLEEDGAWVVDFKSDAVAPGKERFQAKRYEKQLDIYAKAVEKIMEVPVRGRTVYFLATGAGVEVGPPRQE